MRLRLTLWFVLGVMFLAATGVWAAHAVLDHQLRASLDRELADVLVDYAEAVARARNAEQLLLATRVYLEGPGSSYLRQRGMILSLRTADGRVISNSEDVRLEELSESPDGAVGGSSLATVLSSHGSLRLAGTPVVLDGRPVAGVSVAASLRDLENTLDQVLLLLALGAVLGTAVTGLGSWVLVGRALDPVRRITRTAGAISREDLSRRIRYQGPQDEIGELAATMDAMLDRLQDAFAAQERLISDVSHELRTPLTIAKGHLQVLDRQEELDPATLHEEHALILDELDRLNRLVGELLTLARANRNDFLRKEEVELDPFLRTLSAQGSHLAEREWRLDVLPGGRLAADQDRLTQVFLNLMQNAAAHTREGQVVALGGEWDQAGVRLWVRDEGEGMAADVRERVFDRFYRGPDGAADRASGGQRLGLGLAIVKALVLAHDGDVVVESRPGAGSRFIVSIPA